MQFLFGADKETRCIKNLISGKTNFDCQGYKGTKFISGKKTPVSNSLCETHTLGDAGSYSSDTTSAHFGMFVCA